MHTIGRINKSIYSCITEDIVTDEVIITDNQLQHILDRHLEVYKEVTDYLNDIISAPDFIIKDNNTIHCWQQIVPPQKNLDLKGRYYEVLAHQLSEANLFVSAINPKLWNVHSGIADIRIYVYQIVL